VAEGTGRGAGKRIIGTLMYVVWRSPHEAAESERVEESKAVGGRSCVCLQPPHYNTS
jgi:hypothetical protein